MLTHLQAIESLWSSLGYTIHRWTAPAVTEQYVVLSAPGWGGDPERSVAGLSESFAAEVRVMAVAATCDGVAIMLGRMRALAPSRAPKKLTVASRAASLQFVRSEFLDVDRSTVIAGTSLNPAYGVDTYLLTSDPA